ncbi:hypothetical protein [Mesonia sp. K4-1]|nr:hypothetical protein [Mesonia sp. K4-1]
MKSTFSKVLQAVLFDKTAYPYNLSMQIETIAWMEFTVKSNLE